jgi:hypothetical protein
MVAETFGEITDMSNAIIQPEPLMSLLASLKANGVTSAMNGSERR